MPNQRVKTLVDTLNNPDLGNRIDSTLQNTAVDTMDWTVTLPRIAQVFAAAYANGSYDPNPLLADHHPLGVDGSDYSNTAFDKMMFHQNADGSMHLTHAGMAMVGISGGVGFFSGVARGIYKNQHEKNLNSRKRLRAMMTPHLTEAEAEACLNAEENKEAALAAFSKIDVLNEFQNEIDQFNRDRKNGEALTEAEKNRINLKFNAAFQKLNQDAANTRILENLVSAYRTQDVMDQAIAQAQAAENENSPHKISTENGQFVIHRVSGSVFNKAQRTEEKPRRTGINAFFYGVAKIDNHRFATRIAAPFNWMVNQSMWYWLAWFMALIIVGPIAVGSAPVLLGLGAVAGGIGLAISAIKGIGRKRLHSKHQQQRADIIKLLATDQAADLTDQSPTFKASIVAMKAYYAERLNKLESNDRKAAFLLRKYEKYQAKDAAMANAKLTAWKSRTFMDFEHAQSLEKIDILRSNRALNAPIDGPHASFEYVDAPKKRIMDYLQPSVHETRLRMANNIIGAIAFGFVIPFFITQLLGGLLSAAVIATVGASVLGTSPIIGAVLGTINGAALSTLWGGLWAAKNGLTAFIGQRNARAGFQQKLDALNHKVENQESKIERFDRLQASYDKKLAYLKKNHKALYKAMKHELVDSKHWSATNHHYHEKQRGKATPWTRIKQGMNRAYEAIGGAETGILVARVLFLSGCVLAFTLAGAATVAVTGVTFGLAPIVFTAIAGVLGGILGGNRLLKYHLGKRQNHREKFVNTFDDRLKFLEQKNEALNKLLAIDQPQQDEAPQPDPDALGDGQAHRQEEMSVLAQNTGLNAPVIVMPNESSNEPPAQPKERAPQEQLAAITSSSPLSWGQQSTKTKAPVSFIGAHRYAAAAKTETAKVTKETEPATTTPVIHYEKVNVKPTVILANSNSALFGKQAIAFQKPALETGELPHAAPVA